MKDAFVRQACFFMHAHYLPAMQTTYKLIVFIVHYSIIESTCIVYTCDISEGFSAVKVERGSVVWNLELPLSREISVHLDVSVSLNSDMTVSCRYAICFRCLYQGSRMSILLWYRLE